MSNLGDYQKIVEASKKVGGPKNVLAIAAGTGIALGAAAATTVIKVLDGRKAKKSEEAESTKRDKVYTITAPANLDKIPLTTGANFKVVARDRDAVIIDIAGDDNNPYVVDYDLLQCISDYE